MHADYRRLQQQLKDCQQTCFSSLEHQLVDLTLQSVQVLEHGLDKRKLLQLIIQRLDIQQLGIESLASESEKMSEHQDALRRGNASRSETFLLEQVHPHICDATFLA